MKAKFGAIVVEGRGKLGGHVMSRNRAGSYLRTKVTPVNPSTTYQVNVRGRLAGIASAWKGLTATQRQAWNDAVPNFQKTDIFGDLRKPAGINLYQRINNALLTIGEAVVTTPPTPAAVPAFSSFTLTADVSDSKVTATFAAAIAVTEKVKLWGTAPQSAGKSFVKSEYRLLGILNNADVSPLEIQSYFTTKFGGFGAAGQKIFVKMSQVSIANGLEGASREASCIIVA
jgi:hypothetical protein